MKYKLMCNKCECDDFEDFFDETIEYKSIDDNDNVDWLKLTYDIKCKNCGNEMFCQDADVGRIEE